VLLLRERAPVGGDVLHVDTDEREVAVVRQEWRRNIGNS